VTLSSTFVVTFGVSVAAEVLVVNWNEFGLGVGVAVGVGVGVGVAVGVGVGGAVGVPLNVLVKLPLRLVTLNEDGVNK